MDKLPSAEHAWTGFLTVLDTLPPATRAVYLLRALFDASDEDVERLTGIAKDACAQHLEEARRAVRAVARGVITESMRDPTQ